MQQISNAVTAVLVWLAPKVAYAKAMCTVNGEEVPCPEFSGALVLIPIAFVLVGIAAFVFWLVMLIHAARHPIKDKVLWILILLITGILGAIVYYFVVKRHVATATPAAPAAL